MEVVQQHARNRRRRRCRHGDVFCGVQRDAQVRTYGLLHAQSTICYDAVVLFTREAAQVVTARATLQFKSNIVSTLSYSFAIDFYGESYLSSLALATFHFEMLMHQVPGQWIVVFSLIFY